MSVVWPRRELAVLISRGCEYKFRPRKILNLCRALALRVYSAHSLKLVPTIGGRESST